MLNADFPLNIPFLSNPRALLLMRVPGLKPRLTLHINHGPALQSLLLETAVIFLPLLRNHSDLGLRQT